jgi:hypothetical protein
VAPMLASQPHELLGGQQHHPTRLAQVAISLGHIYPTPLRDSARAKTTLRTTYRSITLKTAF